MALHIFYFMWCLQTITFNGWHVILSGSIASYTWLPELILPFASVHQNTILLVLSGDRLCCKLWGAKWALPLPDPWAQKHISCDHIVKEADVKQWMISEHSLLISNDNSEQTQAVQKMTHRRLLSLPGLWRFCAVYSTILSKYTLYKYTLPILPPLQASLHVPGQQSSVDRWPPHGLLHHLLLLWDGDCRSPGHWPVLRSLYWPDSHVCRRGVAHTPSRSLWHTSPAGCGGGHSDRSGQQTNSRFNLPAPFDLLDWWLEKTTLFPLI